MSTKEKKLRPEEQIQPLWDWLLCEQAEESLELAEGLVAPDSARLQRSVTATVLAAGPDAPDWLAPGTIVVKSPEAGTFITLRSDNAAVLLLDPQRVEAIYRGNGHAS